MTLAKRQIIIMASRRQKNPYQIYRIDGKDCFIEVMGGMIDKGKIQLNFVEYDPKNGNKQTAIINTYIDLPIFIGLIEGILSGEMRNRIEKAKASKSYEGHPVNNYTSYFTSMGGTSEEAVKANFEKLKEQYPWLSEGDAISRQFKIQSGAKYPYILRGEVSVGKSNEKGLIVPNGIPKKFINIPVTYDMMMAFAGVSKMYISAYYSQLMNNIGEKLWKNQSSEYNFSFVN